MLRILKSIDNLVEKFCKILILISITIMLSLTIMAIVMRWFDMTFLWIEPLVRQFVFFSAFLGGALATSRRQHISIDILGKFIEGGHFKEFEKPLRFFLDLVCLLTLIWLIHASVKFTQIEFQFGRAAFLGIHSGFLVGLIPLGFSLMAYRFFYLLVASNHGSAKKGKA